ncbi:unnamed protein product, partial [Cylicocyclus nassatus]
AFFLCERPKTAASRSPLLKSIKASNKGNLGTTSKRSVEVAARLSSLEVVFSLDDLPGPTAGKVHLENIVESANVRVLLTGMLLITASMRR